MSKINNPHVALDPLRRCDSSCGYGEALAVADEHGGTVFSARVHRFPVLPPHMHSLVVLVYSIVHILRVIRIITVNIL